MAAMLTRWWWVRHAPVPDGGFIYGQRDLDCDCGDAEVFAMLARELPADAVWLTSNLVRTRQTAAAILAAARMGGMARSSLWRCPTLPSSTSASGRAWSGAPSMPSAGSARIPCGSRRRGAPAGRGELRRSRPQRVFPAIERAERGASRPRHRRRHARRHDQRRAGPGARHSVADRARLHRGELLADPPRSPGARRRDRACGGWWRSTTAPGRAPAKHWSTLAPRASTGPESRARHHGGQRPVTVLDEARSGPVRGLLPLWHGCIAQLVEQLTLNQRVAGSNPATPTNPSY